MGIINVRHLNKEYKVYEQKTGFINTFQSFFRRDMKIVRAVNDLSFSIEPGEIVGFIGENGAGKSTTIKIISGILYPTSGEAVVDGLRPYENRRRNAMNIGVIFGQRTRLLWDLPMLDSFELYKEIYQIDAAKYRRNVEMFSELLDMRDFLKTPVRQLSLGQRMKADISLAMLHSPKILYLDEPTIGLDVLAKSNIRKFIVDANRLNGTTTILTSHDMKDLDQACSRIIMISKGSLLYDGAMDAFKAEFGGETLLKVTFSGENVLFHHPMMKVTADAGVVKNIVFDKNALSLQQAMAYITGNFEVVDISVAEADIEQIVRGIYMMNRNV
jgi:ABC-2 type transport system ATP-binding protein